MLRMLRERVEDRAFLNLIGKWLKAGVLEEDGEVIHPVAGTPQGGIVSPVLANIYLHYVDVLDVWFEKGFQRICSGKSMLIRYADDFVCAFSNRDDAQRFEKELSHRLAKFGLETAPEKTRILRFSRYIAEPNDAFEFLGFEYRWVRRRTGKMGVRRRTSPERLRTSIKSFDEWIKTYRNCRISTIMESLSRKFRGYWNYYGVRGNFKSLSKFYHSCRSILFKRLNRCSQRRSYTWEAFENMLKHFCVPGPRIVERPRNQLSFQF
jgi:retron-type reverse transcriptase